MSEHEGHSARAVYDHEVDDPRLTGRRRPVADWGVGEEIFDRMPRRRFRHGEGQRRDHHARERRSGRFEGTADEPRPRRFEATGDEPRFEARVDEPRAVTATDDGSAAPIPPIEPAPPMPPAADLPPAAEPRQSADGRRTVVIRGHGAERAWTPRYRPPRTVGERIGPRPDRLAAWAVALGMLLILIAVLTAHG